MPHYCTTFETSLISQKFKDVMQSRDLNHAN